MLDPEPETIPGYSLHSTFCREAFAEAFSEALRAGDVTAAGAGDTGSLGTIVLDGEVRTREFAPPGESHKRLHIPEAADLGVAVRSSSETSTWEGTHRVSIERPLHDTERGAVTNLLDRQCRRLAEQLVKKLDERLGDFRAD